MFTMSSLFAFESVPLTQERLLADSLSEGSRCLLLAKDKNDRAGLRRKRVQAWQELKAAAPVGSDLEMQLDRMQQDIPTT